MTVEEAVEYKEEVEKIISKVLHEFHKKTGLYVDDLMFVPIINESTTTIKSMSGTEEIVSKVAEKPRISMVVSL